MGSRPTVTIQLADGQTLTLDVEEYLRGVVPAEMPPSWPAEALKAQAVAARSYALYKAEEGTLATDESHQVYNSAKIDARTDTAVAATRGIVGVLPNTRQIMPMFYGAACGGHTDNSWGPTYLKSVECPCGWPLMGHGQGMCQHGAEELADRGLDWRAILDWYYTLDYAANYNQEAPMFQLGWHGGNEGPITDLDWEIMGIVRPGVFVWLPFQQVAVKDLRRILDLNPTCKFIPRPYCPPSVAASDAEVERHFDDGCRAVDQMMEAGIPEDQQLLQIFNEQNMPRWADSWEGFGDQPADMIRFNRLWLRGRERIKAHAPHVKLLWTPLTPGNRDCYFPGDPEGVHYYLHGPEAAQLNPTSAQIAAAKASCLCHDSLLQADAFAAHIYLHNVPATVDYGGLRFAQYAKFLPRPMDVWITVAGYPSVATFGTGDKLIQWLSALRGFGQVRGVALWILGEHWGGLWYQNGRPRPEVYQIRDWLAEQGEVTMPEPTLPTDEAIREGAWNRLYPGPIPYNPVAAFPAFAREHGLGAPNTAEFDLDGARCQGYTLGIVWAPIGVWDDAVELDW